MALSPSDLELQPHEPAQVDELVASYQGGNLNRREFLGRLAVVTGSMAAAHLVLERTGMAQVLSEKEALQAKVSARDVTFPNGELQLQGYLCAPEAEGRYPAVIVIHENRGLNEHTRDVARRFAAAGFVALAADGLSRVGGTKSMKTPDEARTAIGTLTMEQTVSELEAGLAYLDSLPNVQKGNLGSVGFCWGGARSFALATQSDRLKAAVVFYGSAPEQPASVKCPVLGLYGETDERITSKVPEVAAAMKATGKSYEYKVYPGAGHAFFNDTGERYNADAAKDAWGRTLEFLRAHLK